MFNKNGKDTRDNIERFVIIPIFTVLFLQGGKTKSSSHISKYGKQNLYFIEKPEDYLTLHSTTFPRQWPFLDIFQMITFIPI